MTTIPSSSRLSPDEIDQFAKMLAVFLEEKPAAVDAVTWILERVARRDLRADSAETLVIQILLLHDGHLIITHSTDPLGIGTRLALDDSVCGVAVQSGNGVIVSDVTLHPKYKAVTDEAMSSELAIPLRQDDHTAVLNVESNLASRFSSGDQSALEHSVRLISLFLPVIQLTQIQQSNSQKDDADSLVLAIADCASALVHKASNQIVTIGNNAALLRELLGTRVSEDPMIRRHLDAIKEGVDSLGALRDEISQIERRVRGQSGPTETTALIERQVELLRNDGEPRVEFRPEPGPHLVICPGFEIIMDSLLQNALHAVRKRHGQSPAGRVEVSTHTIGPNVCVTVVDNGLGISANELGSVFQFGRTTKVRTGSGLGMGMWLVRQIVRRAGGAVDLKSTPGESTTVRVILPRVSE